MLALLAVACGAPARPAHEVSLATSPGASVAPAALPLPLHQMPIDDGSPVVIAQARELLAQCPRFFSLDTAADCDRSFEPSCFDPVAGEDPLDRGERLRRAHTALRMATDASPETAAVGRYLVASYATVIRGADNHDPESLCTEPAVARRLFEVLERADRSHERGRTLADEHGLHQLSQLAVCGDIEALGLLERVQRLSRRQIERDVHTPGIEFWSAVWILAAAYNPRSRPLRQLFIEGFEASSPMRRNALSWARPYQLALAPPGTFDEDFCAMAARFAMSDEPDDAAWTSQVFLFSECQTHRDRFLKKLDERLAARATLTVGPLMALEHLCDRGPVPTLGRTQAFDLLEPLTGPANRDARTRAQALTAACMCDRPRSRPLVARAERDGDSVIRAAAVAPKCRR